MTTRRRFLTISAAAFALPSLVRAANVTTWTGQALGARTVLRLAHPDAQAIAARAMAEMARLERVFSLFQPESALSRLNAAGTLANPPFELLECLSLAGAVHRASEGRFDPTVQPLWAAYAQAGGTPLAAQLDRARALTGWGGVTLAPDAITLRPGMALTLNGIAQGYIADRVAALLAAEGLNDILVDTGEFRALGGHPGGGAWPVQLASGGEVPLTQRALATSAPLGTCFDAGRQQGHILDPRTGHSAAPVWQSITVSAPSAALADALSTSACLAQTRAEIDATLAPFPGAVLEAAIAAKG
ncbi:FAD:protein FMN transferase [Pseudorhodobacter sp. E13]|uniref:FAD:protein FMN transferase n=1 Tax=Pseudorhodobacter sp. E13 TaxID=2487931 RepID=UPI000F8EBED4|nr:FAD:protein FMN transferase [Pseudorhodobacter sp. E13]RUS59527.1 FAD:protein FMN transferase [Pseudorhodobacter sp. E13]